MNIGNEGYSLESEPGYASEEQAVSDLKTLISSSGLFTIYSEIHGQILQPRPLCKEQGVKIDMIAAPKDKLRKAGWLGGPVGIECKKSGVKVNDAFSQTLDYARSVWHLPNGYIFMCRYFFLFPFHKASGFMASVMAQNRIGTLFHDNKGQRWERLAFFCGENKVLTYRIQDDIIDIGNLNFGFRTGSR